MSKKNQKKEKPYAQRNRDTVVPENLKALEIYTDGACTKNPGGNGGYGIIWKYKGLSKEFNGGLRCTTANRMEVMAAIVALEKLKESCKVTLYSDSQYLVYTMMRNWRKSKNIDLWEKLIALCQRHYVMFKWIKGHNGNENNERCDALAEYGSRRRDLVNDAGYIKY